MQQHKRFDIYIALMIGLFAVGISVGAIYAGNLGNDTSETLRAYLSEYFANGARPNKEIFIGSLYDNLKIFAVIFIAGFFKAGIAADLGISLVEGFISGFGSGTLIKLLGFKGFLLGASSIASSIIFVPALVIYGAYSVRFGLQMRKNEYGAKKEYFIFSALALTIFCVGALFDGYITTTFMKLIVTGM